MRKSYLQVRPSSDGQYYWRLRSANNETICFSETFRYRYQARDAALRAKEIMAEAEMKD